MKKFLALILMLTMILSMTACVLSNTKSPVTLTAPTASHTEAPTQDPTNPMPTETQPTDPRIAEMQELLAWKGNYNPYNLALISEYSTPADVDLYYIFCYGFKDESKTPTEYEVSRLENMYGPNLANREIIRLPINKMDAKLTELFDITLSQTNRVGLDRFTYLEETECYYGITASDHSVSIRVLSVEDQEDGTVRVYYNRGSNPHQEMIITLKPMGDGYQVLSNVYASPMIGEMQSLFDWKGETRFYNYALMSEYSKPEDVDMLFLFYNGFHDESQEPTEEELVLLEDKMGEFWKEMDLIRLPVEKMNAVLTELFGIALEQTNRVGLDQLIYLEETNCYYMAHTGIYYADLTVDSVEIKSDGGILVQYSDFRGDYVVKLMPTKNGGYQIISNTQT